MDTLRFLGDSIGNDTQWHDDPLDLTGFEHFADAEAEANACHAPPPAIGQDERRMQVRAYNFWAGLLGEEEFPEIFRLDPDGHPDFGPFSVLLDLSDSEEDPRILHLGKALSQACGCSLDAGPTTLSDLPHNTLLSRITGNYRELIASRAPIGFEAEFAAGPDRLAIYRGILLPFSSDGHAIDHVYGVLNWKELVDAGTHAETNAALAASAQTVRRDVVQDHAAEHDTPWGRPVAEPIAQRLRSINPLGFEDIDGDGPEFTLLMARRMGSGNVVLLGELPYDPAEIERASDGLTTGQG